MSERTKEIRKGLVKIIFLACALLVVLSLMRAVSKTPANNSEDVLLSDEKVSIWIGGTEIRAEIADSSEERIKGLSGRGQLAEREGLLFVFDAPEKQGIWMKEMNFPIDIIWLDANKRILTVAENISPETFPKVFYPSAPALYVLEVSGGTASKYGIMEGQTAVFEI